MVQTLGQDDGGEFLRKFASTFARFPAVQDAEAVHEVAGKVSFKLADELAGTLIGDAVQEARGDGSKHAVLFDARPNSWRLKLHRTPALADAFAGSSALEATRAAVVMDSLAVWELLNLVRVGNPWLLAAEIGYGGALLQWGKAFDGTQFDGERVLGDVALLLHWAVTELEPGKWTDAAKFGARAAAFTIISAQQVLAGHAQAMLEAIR